MCSYVVDILPFQSAGIDNKHDHFIIVFAAVRDQQYVTLCKTHLQKQR